MYRNIKLSQICKNLKLQMAGEDVVIDGLGFCDRKNEYSNILSYATSKKYAIKAVNNPQIKCIVLEMSVYEIVKNSGDMQSYIIAAEPEAVFYNIHDFLLNETMFYHKRYDKPIIGKNCSISGRAIIYDGAVIGDQVTIGDHTIIFPDVEIENGCHIGNNCIIGDDGFQLININGIHRLIPHTGGVLIRAGTNIKNGVVICKSLFDGCTYIGENVNIDNLVCISHNLKIGNGAVIVSGAFLCGGCIVGKNVWIGPNSTIMNKVEIGDNAKIGIGSVVFRNVKQGMTVYGNPAIELRLPGYFSSSKD